MFHLKSCLASRCIMTAIAGLLIVGLLHMPAQGQTSVSSYLEGRITVSAAIDSSSDYSGFEVIIGTETPGGELDTLGYAVTNRQGRFSVDVSAPRRGIYSVLIYRNNSLLTIGDIAIAEGDSASLRIEYPLNSRWLPLRSKENASWLAYNNTRIQHMKQLSQLFEENEEVPGDSLGKFFQQTANILWGLRSTFPNTIGAEFAAAESVSMLAGWNDELALARAAKISPSNPRFIDVARAVRRALVRQKGLEAAVARVKSYIKQAESASVKAALQAELVRTYLDGLQQEKAVQAAQVLQEKYPDSPWAAWARRAEYEAAHLMPGMPAPDFTAQTVDGDTFGLDSLRGQIVVLEFWAPQSEKYQQQLSQINQLCEQVQDQPVSWVAINLASNPEMYEVFKQGRTLPGIQVQSEAAKADSLVKLYNLSTLPTRFLIDRDGNLLGKYVGNLGALRADLLQHLGVSS